MILLFSSCMQRYQIFVISSKEQLEAEKEEYLFRNQDLEVKYDFWSDGGTMLFNVYNISKDTLYLHMKNSKLTVNEEDFKYYVEEINEGLDLPDSSGQLVYSPYWQFEPVITLPPMEDGWFEGFPVAIDWVRIDNKNANHTQRFSKVETPLRFQNILSYGRHPYWGAETFESEFWVSMVKQASNSRFETIAASDISKGNKFYVSRKLAKGDKRKDFWLDIGLSVLETLPYLF